MSPLEPAAENLAAYRSSCQCDGASPAAVARRVSAITGFFRHTDPAFALVPDPRDESVRVDDSSTVALRPDETEGLLASLGRFGARIDVLVAALLLDGLKLSEVLDLDVEDVSGRPPDMFASVTRRGHRQAMQLDRADSRRARRPSPPHAIRPGAHRREPWCRRPEAADAIRCRLSAEEGRAAGGSRATAHGQCIAPHVRHQRAQPRRNRGRHPAPSRPARRAYHSPVPSRTQPEIRTNNTNGR